MAGRASIVGAAETNVGKVRDHNEDSHFIDPEAGLFVVCDGMGGHAAGEVASAIAVATIRECWQSSATEEAVDEWLSKGTPEARRELIAVIVDGVIAAHEAIVGEGQRDKTKGGMGTTLVGALIVGGDAVFAHCGDSRAYIVRDGIAMQLTEDHTLLARLLAAGVDVDTDGEGSRFKSMLTNALGIGHECKVSTFIVPVADGDRFLLCSDGVTEYVGEAEIGTVLTTMPSPARSAQRLVEMALERGGGDNATALVVRVLEAGETARPPDQLRREDDAIRKCPLWAKLSAQQRLRALRIALLRDHADGEKLPAHTMGDRVSWILVEGLVEQDGEPRGPGSLLYPEALLSDRPLPERDALAIAQGEVRALALRADDFRELCEEDAELGEALLGALAAEIAARHQLALDRSQGRNVVGSGDWRVSTDPAGKPAPDPAAPEAIGSDEPSDNASVETATTLQMPVVQAPKPEAKAEAKAEAKVAADGKPEPRAESEMARASTDPAAGGPRLPRASTPPAERLIVPREQLTQAAEQVDQAVSNLTIEITAAKDGHDDKAAPARASAGRLGGLPQPGPAKPLPIAKIPSIVKPVAKQDASEPEISIEAVEEAAAKEDAGVPDVIDNDDARPGSPAKPAAAKAGSDVDDAATQPIRPPIEAAKRAKRPPTDEKL